MMIATVIRIVDFLDCYNGHDNDQGHSVCDNTDAIENEKTTTICIASMNKMLEKKRMVICYEKHADHYCLDHVDARTEVKVNVRR